MGVAPALLRVIVLIITNNKELLVEKLPGSEAGSSYAFLTVIYRRTDTPTQSQARSSDGLFPFVALEAHLL